MPQKLSFLQEVGRMISMSNAKKYIIFDSFDEESLSLKLGNENILDLYVFYYEKTPKNIQHFLNC